MVSGDNSGADVDRLTGFLRFHHSSTHARFLISEASNEAKSSTVDQFYCLNGIVSTKFDFLDGRHSFIYFLISSTLSLSFPPHKRKVVDFL